MATAKRSTKRPSFEESAMAPLVEAMELQDQHQHQFPLQVSAHGTVQRQHPSTFATDGVPVPIPTARAVPYVGIPIHGSEGCAGGPTLLSPPPPPPPSYEQMRAESRVHGDVSVGVGADYVGADRAARERAREDNLAFFERKGFTEAQARARVEADLRAIEVARINAKRRDSEGLDMRPHPGNRLEPEEGSLLGEKEMLSARAAAGRGDSQKSGGKETASGAGAGEGEKEEAPASGGYKCAEYTPTDYTIQEYKSIYETPPRDT
ncbi:unnamed protein product [Scytosiphon promiscuus]